MTEEKMMRLSQTARKYNVGINTIVEFLAKKGFNIESSPNTKITPEHIVLLNKEFASSAQTKQESEEVEIKSRKLETITSDKIIEPEKKQDEEDSDEVEEIIIPKTEKLKGITILGKVDISNKKDKTPPADNKIENNDSKTEQSVNLEHKAPAEPEKPQDSDKPKEKEKTQQDVEIEEKSEIEVPKSIPEEEKPVSESNKEEPKKEDEPELIGAKAERLAGITILDKIELPDDKPKKKKPFVHPSKTDKNVSADDKKKRVRKKISVQKVDPKTDANAKNKQPFVKKDKKFVKPGTKFEKKEVSQKEIQEQLKKTLSKISGSKGSGLNRAKYRKEKRSQIAEEHRQFLEQEEIDSKILKVTEFISANELASLMNVSVNEVISTCLSLGMFVSINQRLDAEAITVIADEFGYDVKFISSEEDEVEVEEDLDDDIENVVERAPIVTIMGHVDHGKTSLLDYIRKSNVTAGEAGGITQHIGAYSVDTKSGRNVTFLDTPGHEAFTAMRARGAQVTDIVIIVVAADDSVMPQTKEAINHAKAAGVPIVIAINKIDKPNANPEKIKEELANENILVEDWGGKYQCQAISAKSGKGIDDLLEKVLLEAEILELKANPNKQASGTVVEASLDKGRGYITTVLVQKGTLKIGDILLAGSHFGKVKAMTDYRGKKMKEAGPSMPVQVLGLDGAPQAGDKFVVKDTEREAREISTSRAQIKREQSFRTKKHITLDEIGRRLAVGNFKELNIIVKGDVDGSVEALSDSLLKLSTNEVAVSIIQKGVGQISESDVLLASASDAIIIGFQVRPSVSARKLAENEEIEVKLYSIIYDAINDIKDAMEGMLEPKEEEVIVGNAEVRDTFKISKIGVIAGCMVTDGVIKRNNGCRLIRDGVVIYSGDIDSLKRFKDDASEVKFGYECGIGIKNYNDIRVGDIIESYEIKETKRKL